ncbi:MAG: calcium/sodium antiporter [Desulfohalobiaceae bacterium]
MTLAILAVVAGLLLLVWSADRFVEGAAALARHFGMPALLIGMVVVGFGTSAPELAVSTIAAMQGNAGIALGNAYGSNIANIALILGVTALIKPVVFRSQVLHKELPILATVTALSAWQLWDGRVTRVDALVLLAVFAGLIGWSIFQGFRQQADPLAGEMQSELDARESSLGRAFFWLLLGLGLLVASSRMLVWGAVIVAQNLGVSDLVIGLTVVAIGTSLPELAASIMAVRKGEHDLAVGNILGSNLFNTLAVVGLAGIITPFDTAPEVLSRDVAVMAGLTLLLFFLGYGFFGRQGRINRMEGALLLLIYLSYSGCLLTGAF